MKANERSPGRPSPGGGRPSHVGPDGEARMVDVGEKAVTEREALARAVLEFPAGTLERLLAGGGPKGDGAAVKEVARVAAIQAAKRTSDWIPMCHPLLLEGIEVEFERTGSDRLEVRCRVRTRGRTGVEMEALVGASAGALCVYDMAKALDHGIRIGPVELLEKRGGRSGPWRAPHPPQA